MRFQGHEQQYTPHPSTRYDSDSISKSLALSRIARKCADFCFNIPNDDTRTHAVLSVKACAEWTSQRLCAKPYNSNQIIRNVALNPKAYPCTFHPPQVNPNGAMRVACTVLPAVHAALGWLELLHSGRVRDTSDYLVIRL